MASISALFDYSESETSLLNPTVLLQTSPAMNANPTVKTDLNLELVWPKPVPASCVIKQSLSFSCAPLSPLTHITSSFTCVLLIAIFFCYSLVGGIHAAIKPQYSNSLCMNGLVWFVLFNDT